MKLHHILFFSITLLLFIAILSAEMKKEDQLAHAINHEVVQKFKQQYDLACCGFSIVGPKKIEQMCLIFNLEKILDKKSLRELIVNCTEEYFCAISSKPDLHPYLCDPFTQKNIDIFIFIYDEKGKGVNFPNIGAVRQDGGTVTYLYWDLEEDGECYIRSQESEPYEEALKVVENKE